MDKTIIFSQLSHTVAELTQCSDADAENFLRELFSLAAESLEEDGEVNVPFVGRFVVTSETVAFVPDLEFAEAVNAPFAAFEPVELPEGMDDTEEPAESEPEEAVPTEPAEAAEEEIAAAAEFEEENDAVEEPVGPIGPISPIGPIAEPEPEVAPAAAAERPRRSAWVWAWTLLFGALCFGCGWAVGRFSAPAGQTGQTSQTSQTSQTGPTCLTDSIVEPEPEPEPEPAPVVVTDTITATRYLTTMARAHYGQMEYWVYIYEENASQLGHPDRLNAGTVVVIPPAAKYGLTPGDPEKLKEASVKAIEIYSRFN